MREYDPRYVSIILFAVCLLTAASATAGDPPSFPPLKSSAEGLTTRVAASPMPSLSDRGKAPGPLGRLVWRDLRTGEVEYLENVRRDDFLAGRFDPGGEGARTDPALGSPDKNFTSWSQVADPTVGNIPMHAKVRTCWTAPCNKPYGGNCSGTFIDPIHVLTAGHCVHNGSDWAEELTVHPGYDFGDAAWGHANVTQMYSWEGWTVDEDASHDIAVLVLDRPLGALTGWRGYGTSSDCDWFEEGAWSHHAYPAEAPFDGESMFRNTGTFDECSISSHQVAFDNPSWGGSSGAGGVRDAVVWAILRGSDRETRTDHALITENKFEFIRSLRFQNRPDTPDLRPIFVQVGEGPYFSGEQLNSLSFVLVNYSEAPVITSAFCRFYLSEDEVITTGDHYLGHELVAIDLPAMGGQHVQVTPTPTVPVGLDGGWYFFGVILEYNDAIPGNNTTGAADLDSVSVNCPIPTYPTIVAPEQGAVCRPLTLTIDWSESTYSDFHELRIGSDCSGGEVIDVGSASQYTVTDLEPGTDYSVAVRARSHCSDWSIWSICHTFTTQDDPTDEPVFLGPDPGDICHDAGQTVVTWEPVPDATRYELRVGQDCGIGSTYGTGTTSQLLSGLDPGETYRYQIRVRGECLTWGDWSSCGTFTTAPEHVDPPPGRGPPDGDLCGGLETVLHWNHNAGGGHYELQLGTACGVGDIQVLNSNGLELDDLESGVVYYWRVRTHHVCGPVSDWSDCWSFSLDHVAPQNPSTLYSTSHDPGIWSSADVVHTIWDLAWDDCAGVWTQYAWAWDRSPATEPFTVMAAGEETYTESPPLDDGDDHWFHLRAVDWAGNPADGALHLGPFLVDATPPEDVTITRVSAPFDLWGDYGEVTVSWEPATDAASGVAGYSYVFEPTSGSGPDTTVDTTEESVGLTVGMGARRFRILALDVAGNAGAVTETGVVMHSGALPAFLVPAAGQEVVEPQTVGVAWEPVSFVNNGALNLSLDGGLTFARIATLSGAQVSGGSYAWTVPASSTDQAVLQLEYQLLTGGSYTACSSIFSIRAATAVDEETPGGGRTALTAIFPNPFNPMTTISYELATETRVRVSVLDAAGRRVRMLEERPTLGPGRHEVVWDGTDGRGLRVSSGVYFACLETDRERVLKRMVLVK